MLTVSAGNTSPSVRASAETDIIIVRPLTPDSKGYAEISWDDLTWVQWRATWVSSETHVVAGSSAGVLPYVRFVCVSGSIQGEVIEQNFGGGGDVIDSVNATGLTQQQFTQFMKNSGPLTGSSYPGWVPGSAATISPIGPVAVMDVPSPYGPRGSGVVESDSPVHPAPLYIPDGFVGYKYILAFTPYPNADSQYENPCVVVSNDGVNFIVPPGASNPVFPRPDPPGYNADTHLVLAPDYSKVYLIWRERNAGNLGKNRLMVSDSADLVTWTAPVAIKTGLISAPQDFASPSIWYDPEGDQWVCISHNLDSDDDEMQRMTCPGSDIYGEWSDPEDITIINGGSYWHSYFSRLVDGRILGIIMSGEDGSTGALFFAESDDGGQNFSVISTDFSPRQWYRSSFFICPDEQGRLDLVLTFLVAPYRLVRIPCDFKKAEHRTANQIFPVSTSAQAGYLVADAFTRTDGAIGNADTGQTPAVAGTVTVSSNALTVATSGNNRVTWDAESADAIARVKIRTAGSEFWLVGRFTDAGNLWRLGRPSGAPYSYVLQKVVAGVVEVVETLPWNPADGDLLCLVFNGNSISASVNGVELHHMIDDHSNTGTSFGVQGTGETASFFEAFEVLA